MRLVLAAAAVALSSACPNYSVIPDDDRREIENHHLGALLFFKQSMYVGQFYDDDRYRLVHPRKFEELTYLQTIEGDAIPPPPAEGIIPAGTRVRVESIEWPTGDVVFRRPLYTPRYTTWIMLRVARERGPEVTVERDQKHILLLPGGIEDAETFDEWFDASLTKDDPNPWLLSLPEDQQRAIATKKPVKGMHYEALCAAIGYPDRITRNVVDGVTVETGAWGSTTVTLKDDVVDDVSVTKAGAPAAAQPSSDAPPDAPPDAPSAGASR